MPAPRAVLLVAAVLVTALLTPATGSRSAEAVDAPYERPNIVLITTDDQTLLDMKYMPLTRQALGARGATFSNMISPHPLCCPARAEILTGQNTHNNKVRSNRVDRLGGWPRLDHDNTIATWLNAANYRTAFVGKYLNAYQANVSPHEPGWDTWAPLLREFRYFGYLLFENGERKSFPDVHSSDLVGERTVDYIQRLAPADRPFFIWSSHYAPHGECREGHCSAHAVPAERHRHLFPSAVSPSVRDRAFNEKDVSDKPRFIAKLPKRDRTDMNEHFRSRIRSLQAVDEAVDDAVEALRASGELDNTLILFTSDNGYLLGEHRYVNKDVPYEQALRVPFLVRGPGIPAGVVRRQTVSMVDIAPTIVGAADAVPTHVMDGRTVLPIARTNARTGYDTMLIQAGPRTARQVDDGWAFRGVRTNRYTYVRHRDPAFVELYDRRKDPAQMENVAQVKRYRDVRRELHRRYQRLADCRGVACHRYFGPV